MSYRQGETCWYQKLPQYHETWMRKPFVHASEGHCNSAGNMLSEVGAIISLLPSPPCKVIEAGCADGYLCHCLSLCGYQVTGIDVCESIIEQAQIGEVIWNNKVSRPIFKVSDFDNYSGDAYSVVIFNNSLHHSVDQKQTLISAYNYLTCGGVLIVNEPGIGHETKQAKQWSDEMDVTEKSTPPYRVISMGKEIGFKCPRIYPSPGTLHKSLYQLDGLNHHSLVKTLSSLFGCLPVLLAKRFHGLVTMIK